MKITIHIPSWRWIQWLAERYAPNTVERAVAHGKASSNRTWLNGAISGNLIIEKEKDSE